MRDAPCCFFSLKQLLRTLFEAVPCTLWCNDNRKQEVRSRDLSCFYRWGSGEPLGPGEDSKRSYVQRESPFSFLAEQINPAGSDGTQQYQKKGLFYVEQLRLLVTCHGQPQLILLYPYLLLLKDLCKLCSRSISALRDPWGCYMIVRWAWWTVALSHVARCLGCKKHLSKWRSGQPASGLGL